MPFWRAALGFMPRPDSPDEDLVDPQDRLPGFWFEHMQEPRGDGGGAIHVAIWMPYEQAEARVAAALAAGGHLVRDRRSDVVDPGGRGRQRDRHLHGEGPRLTVGPARAQRPGGSACRGPRLDVAVQPVEDDAVEARRPRR